MTPFNLGRRSRIVGAATLFTALSVAASQAAVINVDIQGGGDPIDMVGLAAHTDASGATAFWNISGASGGSLIESDGATATGVSYLVSNNAGIFRQQTVGGGQTALLFDYIFDNTQPSTDRSITLDISGLDGTLQYDLYIYGGVQFADNADGLVDFALAGGSTNEINWTGLDGNPDITTQYFLGENYTVFSGLTGTDISVTATTPEGTGEPTIAGFALISAPVPEPSSALLAFGGFALMLKRRRPARL